MAGKGTISFNQQPQYGDKTVIENLKKNTTTTPMTGVKVPAPTAGRPSKGGPTPEPPAQPQANQQAIDPQHENLMAEYAQAFRTNKFWQGVLAQYPSEWTRIYAREAERAFQQKQMQLRNSTPYFE